MNYKTIITTVGAWLWTVLMPALPFGGVCSAMILADFISARRLAWRIRRLRPAETERLKLSSARFAIFLRTLLRTYALLALASMVQTVVTGEQLPLLKFAAGAVCFRQALSILENEASCNGATWARLARRILIDKTERYLGVDLDEYLEKK